MIERYYPKKMKQIWDEESYYRKWLDIEVAVLRARGKNKLADKVDSVIIKPEEVRKKEEVSGHELNAFLEIIEEKIADNAGEVHKGLTSSDVMDTARMLQIKDSLKLIKKLLEKNLNILEEKAVKYKKLIMCGRTHGQFAEPVTLGLKLARFLESGRRSHKRLSEATKRLLVGQLNGAVGTYSLVTPKEEEKILKNLGLKPLGVSSQVIPRDIFADYLYAMAMICSFAEEAALEIRLLSQGGIKEVTEPFTKHQKGSSAMPHKKNPVICERICGLARLVRSYVEVSIANVSLWNERDISHSSNERIIMEESSSLTYYVLQKLEFVLANIQVHPGNIKENLKEIGAHIYSSGVLKLLLDKGMGREEAYALAKSVFMKDVTKVDIKSRLKKEAGIEGKEVDKVLELEYYLRNIEKIFERLEL